MNTVKRRWPAKQIQPSKNASIPKCRITGRTGMSVSQVILQERAGRIQLLPWYVYAYINMKYSILVK